VPREANFLPASAVLEISRLIVRALKLGKLVLWSRNLLIFLDLIQHQKNLLDFFVNSVPLHSNHSEKNLILIISNTSRSIYFYLIDFHSEQSTRRSIYSHACLSKLNREISRLLGLDIEADLA